MHLRLAFFALVLFGLSSSHASEESSHSKHLCISEAAGGVIYKNGWKGTAYKEGEKYLMTTVGGALSSVKEFGAPDDLSVTNCYKLEPTNSYACVSNFGMFRYQPSTRRFVYAQASGFTSEYEEAGIEILATSQTPRIAVGYCEAI